MFRTLKCHMSLCTHPIDAVLGPLEPSRSSLSIKPKIVQIQSLGLKIFEDLQRQLFSSLGSTTCIADRSTIPCYAPKCQEYRKC